MSFVGTRILNARCRQPELINRGKPRRSADESGSSTHLDGVAQRPLSNGAVRYVMAGFD
jgi:hypothetical protein